MPSAHIVRECDIRRTARVMQIEGIFDIPPSQRSAESWDVSLDLPTDWNVGLIVGPSGSGKTTVARELFGNAIVESHEWPHDQSVLDGFPPIMGIRTGYRPTSRQRAVDNVRSAIDFVTLGSIPDQSALEARSMVRARNCVYGLG